MPACGSASSGVSRPAPGSTYPVRTQPVWSRDLRAALLEGLNVYFSDASRQKRQLARFSRINFLISKYIFTKTGTERTCKQVGNHIQDLMQSHGVKSPLDLWCSLRQPPQSASLDVPDVVRHPENEGRKCRALILEMIKMISELQRALTRPP
ncbi:hypothetical protein B0H10DRAFT_2019916 [Mycena sp. CBHHK59/15]|nr:hypothetical protein B0H10DRAFT_2019916 [Mycena sp. CBHHK59/15]